MKIICRYLCFLTLGIIFVYAFIGVTLIYFDTDLLNEEKTVKNILAVNLQTKALGKALHIEDFKFETTENEVVYFSDESYNLTTGVVNYTPNVINKIVNFYKTDSKSTLYFLNIFVGTSLLFFAVSSFILFKPKSKTYKEFIYIVICSVAFSFIFFV